MATIDKTIADRIVAGEFTEDNINRIVRYINAWSNPAYGVTFGTQDKSRYMVETPFVRNPVIYWDPAEGIDRSGEFDT
jgi:hypothetical protein